MIPGKTYQAEDFVAILWRQRWLVVVPTVVIAVAAFGVALVLPNKYRSETMVLVVPQRVPESYVRTTVTTRIEERVRSIREQILSRSRLERIIEEFNLYADDRLRLPMEDVIEKMRDNVGTRIVREDAFTVSFSGDTPQLAQKVTERLAGLFSEENMRDREVQAESTNQFLQTQLDEARQRLTEQERRVEMYRREHTGELPDQVNSNLQAVQNAELQIQTLNQSLNSDRERQLLLERQLADASAQTATPIAADPAVPNSPPTTEEQLIAAEATVRGLETRLTSEHPDLVQARLTVARIRRQLTLENAAAAPRDNGSGDVPSAPATLRQSRIANLKAELSGVARQIAQKVAEEQRLREISARYRARVEAAPTRETEMVALTRDYETLQRQYRSLLEKFEESKISANLERRQIGEQFRVLDPARVPERPYTPRRGLMTAAGAATGMVLGLAWIALREFLDKGLRTTNDVANVLALQVLAVLPTIPTETERRRSLRYRRFRAVAVALLCITTLTAGVVAWRAGVLLR